MLFDIADTTHPLAFNVLHCSRPEQRALTVSGIIGAFKKIWGDFFGPRMEHILRNTLLTLIEVPGSTLLSTIVFFQNWRSPSEPRRNDRITGSVISRRRR